jgi:hypothetical protein
MSEQNSSNIVPTSERDIQRNVCSTHEGRNGERNLETRGDDVLSARTVAGSARGSVNRWIGATGSISQTINISRRELS